MAPIWSKGAGRRIRTDDLLITNQLLYQLSYAGERTAQLSLQDRREQVVDLANGGDSYIRERGRA